MIAVGYRTLADTTPKYATKERAVGEGERSLDPVLDTGGTAPVGFGQCPGAAEDS
jgi:hypothetical protein